MPDSSLATPRSPVLSGTPRTPPQRRRWLGMVVIGLLALLGWHLEIWQGIWLARTAYHQQTWAGRLRAAQAELERLKQENARLKGEMSPGATDPPDPKEAGR